MTIVTLQAVDLTPYGKSAFGRLPTGLGKPAAGFPQLHSLDDDEVHFLSHLGLTLYRCTFMAPLRGVSRGGTPADRGTLRGGGLRKRPFGCEADRSKPSYDDFTTK